MDDLPHGYTDCFHCLKVYPIVSMVLDGVFLSAYHGIQYCPVCTRCYGERHGYSPDETEQAGVADHVGEMDTQRSEMESHQ